MADTPESPETLDTNVQSARNWIDSVTARNQWRLQILSKRYRKNAAGEMVEMPLRIRRFVEGCPASAVKAALDYLLSLAPYTGIVFNGQTIDGEYLPTLTRWSRDDQEVVSSVKARTDGTYTLIQDLIDRRYADEYEFLSQSSCSSEATATYVWDATQIEDVPACGSCVGMSYSIQAVSRNEDGTFDYALVARRALTQHLPETVTEDSALRRVTTETWDNVYPGSTAGTYQDHNGNTLSIPAPGIAGGVETKVTNLGMNEDCTLRLQVTKEQSKGASIRTQSRHTIYQGDHEDDASGAPLPLPIAPEAHGGIISTHESQLQPDGTFANKKAQRIERAVPHAVVEVKVGFKGRRITTTNRYQAAPADTSGIAIGGSVRVERTDGDLYNNTVSIWDRTDPVRSGERCEDNLFSHTDVATTSGIATIPTDHVSGGANGIVRTRRTDMDEEGAIVQTVETSQEKNVEDADEEWSVTVDGVTHRIVHRNRAMLNKGTAPAFSIANIGTTVRNERTPGGLVTVTETSLDRNTGSLKTAADCAKTIFEHSDSSSETNPAGTIPVAPDHVNDAGGGHTYKRQSRLNSVGALVTVEEDTQELPVTEAQMTFRRTTRGLITTRVDRNGLQDAHDPGVSAIGCSSSHEKTPGGLFNLTTVTVDARDAKPDSGYCSKTKFEHVHDTVTMSTGDVDTGHIDDPLPRHHQVRTQDMDQDGFIKTVVRDTEEIEQRNAEVSYRRTLRGLITTTTDRNVTDTATAPTESQVGFSQAHRLNPGGTYDLTKVELARDGLADSGYCAKTVFEHVHDTVTMTESSISGDADDAGNGVHRVRTQDMDQDGFIKTVVRSTEETLSVKSEVEYESDHFTKTKRITVRSTTADENAVDNNTFVAADENSVSRVVISKTPGGRWNKVETTTDAQFRRWDEEVSLGYHYSKVYWFVNAKASDMVTLRNDALTAMHSLLTSCGATGSAGQETWPSTENTSAPHRPSSYSCTPHVTLNKYGTYDGSFTITASWHPESAGRYGDADGVYCHWWYAKLSATHRIITAGGVPYDECHKTQVTVHHFDGRGRAKFNEITNTSGLGLVSFDASYDPITGRFSVTYAYGLNTKITYTKISKYADSTRQWTDTMF